MTKKFSLALAALALGAVLWAQATTGEFATVSAHGKELTLEVSSLGPDPDNPLVRMFRVVVSYADGDLVDEARVRLSATRQGGGPSMADALLEPLNAPGLYAAEVEFPIFGSWDVTLEAVEFGQGEASFVEEVQPAGPDQANTEVRQQVLDLFFRFDWKDVAAIAVRVSHVAGAALWLGMTGLVLVGFWFLPRPARAAMFRRLSPTFLPLSLLGLGVLAVSGVYTGTYSAPIKPPDIFDLDVMMRIPFGPHYMGTMAFKVLALLAYGVVAIRMAPALKTASMPMVAGGALAFAEDNPALAAADAYSAVERSLYRMAVTNAVLGAALAVAVSVAIYLHYISHLAVLIPR